MMKLYILRWNPAVSSFSEKNFNETFPMLNAGECPVMDWSIREYGQLEIGDWWLLVRVGGSADGIVGAGRFLSLPEPDDSWRKDGKTVYYADLGILMLQRPEKSGLFGAGKMEKICPALDWHRGHSGVLVAPEDAEKLAKHIAGGICSRKGNISSSEFSVNNADGADFSLICALLSRLCPQLLADLRQTQKAIPSTDLDRIPDYQDEIAYDENAVNAGKDLFSALKLVSWKGIYPVQFDDGNDALK